MYIKRLHANYLLTILFILIVFGFVLFKSTQSNQRLKNALPFLTVGEKVPDLKLIDITTENAEEISPDTSGTSIFIIFPRPCTICAKNIDFWNKMSSFFKNKIRFYAIVPGSMNDAFNFWKSGGEKSLKFPVYVPNDLESFLKEFRLRLKLSQTILIAGGEIKRILMGQLDGDSAKTFIRHTKELIQI